MKQHDLETALWDSFIKEMEIPFDGDYETLKLQWPDARERIEMQLRVKHATPDSALHFTNFYTSIDLPPMDPKEEDLSEYVLIDLDGWRKEFAIGYFNTSSKSWCLSGRDDRKIDLGHMRWTHLPLNKEEIKESQSV